MHEKSMPYFGYFSCVDMCAEGKNRYSYQGLVQTVFKIQHWLEGTKSK